MRFVYGPFCALALLTALTIPTPSAAYDVLASVIQFAPVGVDDPDPTLTGIIRIDTVTGAATPFIPEGTGNLFAVSDVAVGPHDGLIYASSLGGTIERFDAGGSHLGNFAFFPGTEGGDPVNTLAFAEDGTLYAGTQSGVVAEFNPAGVRQTDVATGLGFTSGIAIGQGGDLYVATGDAGGAGQVRRLGSMGPESVIPEGAIGGASGVTYLPARGDYDGDDQNAPSDYTAWAAEYGELSPSSADGNGDGVVDAADYTLWRDNEGDQARLIVPDFGFTPTNNRLYAHDLIDDAGATLATIPVPLPDPLPNPPIAFPTNFPSEVLPTVDGTLLVSTVGPTQRPLNNGALLEFNPDGTLVQTIQTNLPPLSGIAIAPVIGMPTPEPGAVILMAIGLVAPLTRSRR